MRRYSIAQAIPLSFFSRELYRDTAKSWRGLGLVYLLLLEAILTFLVLVRMQSGLSHWAHGTALALADQVPTIVIRHRIVEVDRPMPYVMRDPKTNRALVVVDTTGQVTSLDGHEALLLLTADHVLYRKSTAETRVFGLAGVDHLTISPTKAKRWLTLISTWAAPVVAPFIFAGQFVCRLIQALLFALIGLLGARLVKVPLDVSALMRLAMVALTPGLVLEALLDFGGWKPPGWGLIWTVITFAYLGWSVAANRPLVDEPSAVDTVA